MLFYGIFASDSNLGVQNGTKKHALTNAELPVLTGGITMHSSTTGTNVQTATGIVKSSLSNAGKYRAGGDLVQDPKTQSIGSLSLSIGGGQAISLEQPSLYLNHLIKI